MIALAGRKAIFTLWTAALLTAVNGNSAHAQSPLPSAQSAQSPQRAFVPGELIVGYKSPQDRESAIKDMKGAAPNLVVRGHPLDEVQASAVGDRAVKLRVKVPSVARSAPGSADELSELMDLATQLKTKDSRVKYAHPNWIVTLDPPPASPPAQPQRFDGVPPHGAPPRETILQTGGPNDPAYVQGLHWHYMPPPMGMNAVGAWRRGAGSRDVVTAVIDSGFIFDHPDAQGSGAVLPGYTFISDKEEGVVRGPGASISKTACASQTISTDVISHGSHVAGTIGAAGSNNGRAIAGLNWTATVLPVRVFGRCGGANVSDISDAIRWAAGLPVDGTARNDHPAHIINMSLGVAQPCTYEQMGAIRDAIDAARAAGAVLVVAAGNEKKDVKHSSPAGCPGAIAVSAADKYGHLAPYSNHGPVHLLAPGGDTSRQDGLGRPDGIWSLGIVEAASPSGFRPMQGTSMASPHVAGAIALAMSVRREWRGKPDVVERALLASTAPLLPAACPHPCGAGQLDALRLIEASPAAVAANESNYLNLQGDRHSVLGEHDTAVAEYSEAIRRDPNHSEAYNGRAWAYLMSGRPAQGLPDVNRSLQLRPNDPHALDTRGRIYQALGRPNEAQADFKTAVPKTVDPQMVKDALNRLTTRR